ncbi:hypothetical protein BASA60_009736 [Batrachochytrium salamandrivorans]|nr:hypothetical protein BASA60_009736 [Batrachochytrium salamandrivorans]
MPKEQDGEICHVGGNVLDDRYYDSTVVFDTKDPQAEGVTGSYVIVASPSTGLPKSVHSTSQVTNLEKRGDTDKNSALPALFDKTMTVPLILNTSTKAECPAWFCRQQQHTYARAAIRVLSRGDLEITAVLALKAQADIVLKSASLTLFESPFTSIHIPGVLNLGPSVKLVASACVSLTAAISAELELSAKMPKFFTKLSASEKVARYPIDPEYSISASATALVNGNAKIAIGPQLALNVGVFGMNMPKTSIEMEVASFMDFSVKGKLQKKIISNGEKDGTATFTALANIFIRAGVTANLFGIYCNLYTSPVLKVLTKEYIKTLMFDKPPAEVASIESAVKLSTQAIKHAIEHPLIGANLQITEQSTLPKTRRPS